MKKNSKPITPNNINIKNFYSKFLKSLNRNTIIMLIVALMFFYSIIAIHKLNKTLTNNNPTVYILDNTMGSPIAFGGTSSVLRPHQLKTNDRIKNFCVMFQFFWSSIYGEYAAFHYEMARYLFHRKYYEQYIKPNWEGENNLLSKNIKINILAYSNMIDIKINTSSKPYTIWMLALQTINPNTTNKAYNLLEYNMKLIPIQPTAKNPWGLAIVKIETGSTILNADKLTQLKMKYPEVTKSLGTML